MLSPPAYPMAFGHWLVDSDRLVCRMPRKTVTVTAPRSLLTRVLELCDGRMAWKDVAAELSTRWSAEAVDPFLAEMSTHGVLVEAGEALARWTDIGQLPSAFPRASTPAELPTLHRVAQDRLLPGQGGWAGNPPAPAAALAGLLKQRESYRTFADQPLDASTLHSILWAAHGVGRAADEGPVTWHRTVASGGNMHSARWFVAVVRELPAGSAAGCVQALAPGLYEARFHVEGGVSLDCLASQPDSTWRMLLDPRVLRFASALLLPVYDIAVPARKYGNRATLFVNLEAGQSLQNAQLMAAALGAASMVRGDTIAAAVLDAVAPHLAGHRARRGQWLAMPCLLAGAKPSPKEIAQQRTDDWIKMAPASLLEQAPCASTGAAARSFAFSAGPIPLAAAEIYAGGRSADPRVAAIKAEAEAWERLGWATLGDVAAARFGQLPHALDPRTIVAYSPQQYRTARFACAPFSERRQYLWKEGVDAASGKAVALPAECVCALSCLPRSFRARAYTNTSTSGVAAWTDAEGALCRATLELIERDAFLRRWLSGQPAPQMHPNSLPDASRERVRALEAAGCRVAVSDIGQGLVPVFSVFVQRHDQPFTCITAAADFSAESALSKALDEAEGRVAHARAFPARPLASASQVQGTTDINRFYQTRRFYQRSDFYAQGPATHFTDAARRPYRDWPALKVGMARQGLGLIALDLTPPGASIDQGRVPLCVVRAVVPGLLPIWFHHGMQPAGLPQFRKFDSRSATGRGDRSAVFIHPFV